MMMIAMLPGSVRFLREPGQPEPDKPPKMPELPTENHPPGPLLPRSARRRAILAVVAEIEREDAARKASEADKKRR